MNTNAVPIESFWAEDNWHFSFCVLFVLSIVFIVSLFFSLNKEESCDNNSVISSPPEILYAILQ